MQLSFEAVFAESAGAKTLPAIRGLNAQIYTLVNSAVYTFLSAVFGLLLSFTFGIFMAFSTFSFTYMISPFLKIFFIFLRAGAFPWRAGMRVMLDPVYESTGRALSYIRVTLTGLPKQAREVLEL